MLLLCPSPAAACTCFHFRLISVEPWFPGPFQASARTWERGYFEQCNGGRTFDVWSTGRYISPQFGVTTGLKVTKMSIGSIWLSLWPGWRLDVLHKSKKWSDSLKRHEFVSQCCPIQTRAWTTSGWISRWVDDDKPWRIWFMVVSPTSCFRPVRQCLEVVSSTCVSSPTVSHVCQSSVQLLCEAFVVCPPGLLRNIPKISPVPLFISSLPRRRKSEPPWCV